MPFEPNVKQNIKNVFDVHAECDIHLQLPCQAHIVEKQYLASLMHVLHDLSFALHAGSLAHSDVVSQIIFKGHAWSQPGTWVSHC